MTIRINLEWLFGRITFGIPYLFEIVDGQFEAGILQGLVAMAIGFLTSIGGVVLLVMLVLLISTAPQSSTQAEGFPSTLMGGFVPPLDPSECAAAVQKLPAIPRELSIGGVVPDAQQLTNACIIIGEVNKEKLPAKAAVIAIAAAMVESGVRNLPYGDRDSVGLFQERPSQGWGTRLQILNQAYATMKFLEHLKAIPYWQILPVGAMAQAVEKSAYPDRYALKETVASAWVAFFSASPSLAMAGAAGVGAGPQVKLVSAAKGFLFDKSCTPVVTQPYGEGPKIIDAEPIDPLTKMHKHHGIDVACHKPDVDGAFIHSVTDGLAHVTLGRGGGYGNNVVVEVRMAYLPEDPPQGRPYFIRYAHLVDGSVRVKDGAQVKVGDILGQEGHTGTTDGGAHLHFEVDQDAPDTARAVDPTKLLNI